MTRTVFKNGEIAFSEGKIFLEPPIVVPDLNPVVDESETSAEEQYHGPTVEELKRDADQFKIQWESEKETMMLSAKLEVDRIIKEAEDEAAEEVERKVQEAEFLKKDAISQAEKIIAEAKQKAQEITTSAQVAIESQRKKAEAEGEVSGREAGFQQGKVEVDRLIRRMHLVLERAQDKRTDILLETEQRIIDMIILIARKVIKVISENQKEVIIANIQDALQKVKGRGDIIIRVHTEDLQIATEHLNNFILALEGSGNVQVQEDSMVDQGGCIIETDFGEIDARIASQLAELETKIMEVVPIKAKSKSHSHSHSHEKV